MQISSKAKEVSVLIQRVFLHSFSENPELLLNITLIAPTTVRLSWCSGNARKYVTDQWGFRIVYKASNDNDTNSVLIKDNPTAVNISRLRSNTNYSFWMMTVSANGFGVTSKAVNVTTLPQGHVTSILF